MFRLPPHFPRLYPHFAVFPLVVRKSTSKSQGVQSWESHPLHKPQRMGHPTEYRAPETPAPHRSKTPSSNGRTDANRIESNRNLSAIAWSIRGNVKDIFLPRPEGGERVVDFQPLFVMRAVVFGFSALWSCRRSCVVPSQLHL